VHHPAINAAGDRERSYAGLTFKSDSRAKGMVFIVDDDALLGARLAEGCTVFERPPRKFSHELRLSELKLEFVKQAMNGFRRDAQAIEPLGAGLSVNQKRVTERCSNGYTPMG
jgi:hypothetical protein